MTKRSLTSVLLVFCVLLVGTACFGLSRWQEEGRDQARPTSPAKQKKHKTAETPNTGKAPNAETKAAKEPGTEKTENSKPETAKSPEPPPPPSPKLIEIEPDNTTYVSRPRTPAIFVFANGDRVESDDYLITRDSLYINKNGKKTRYPINSVDRAATKAANEGRGVEIVFPKSKSEFNLDF